MSATTPEELERTRGVLEKAAEDASFRAAQALSTMVGQNLASRSRVVPLKAGGVTLVPTKDVSVVFSVTPVTQTSFLASFPVDTIKTVRDVLAPGSDETMMPDEMIAFEVANICTSHFLNAIGDIVNIPLLASPPEMAPPANDPTATPGEGYLIHAEFRGASGLQIGGNFRFRPGPEIIAALHKALEVRS